MTLLRNLVQDSLGFCRKGILIIQKIIKRKDNHCGLEVQNIVPGNETIEEENKNGHNRFVIF